MNSTVEGTVEELLAEAGHAWPWAQPIAPQCGAAGNPVAFQAKSPEQPVDQAGPHLADETQVGATNSAAVR